MEPYQAPKIVSYQASIMNPTQRKILSILGSCLERSANEGSDTAVRETLELISYLLTQFRVGYEWFDVASSLELYRYSQPLPRRNKIIALSDLIRALAKG